MWSRRATLPCGQDGQRCLMTGRATLPHDWTGNAAVYQTGNAAVYQTGNAASSTDGQRCLINGRATLPYYRRATLPYYRRATLPHSMTATLPHSMTGNAAVLHRRATLPCYTDGQRCLDAQTGNAASMHRRATLPYTTPGTHHADQPLLPVLPWVHLSPLWHRVAPPGTVQQASGLATGRK